MNCRYLYEHVLNAYKTYDITTFPINCFEIIRKQGFQIIKYSDLNRAKKEACRELSNDACLIEGKLYYDENAHPRRIAFSVAHELGHLFLDTDSEDEALSLIHICTQNIPVCPYPVIRYSSLEVSRTPAVLHIRPF